MGVNNIYALNQFALQQVQGERVYTAFYSLHSMEAASNLNSRSHQNTIPINTGNGYRSYGVMQYLMLGICLANSIS